MESDLTRVIAGFMRTDIGSARVLESAIRNVSTRIAIFRRVALLEFTGTWLEPDIIDLARRLEDVSNLRNKIIHGVWEWGAWGPKGVPKKSYKGITTVEREHTLKEIMDANEEIRSVKGALFLLLNKLDHMDDGRPRSLR